MHVPGTEKRRKEPQETLVSWAWCPPVVPSRFVGFSFPSFVVLSPFVPSSSSSSPSWSSGPRPVVVVLLLVVSPLRGRGPPHLVVPSWSRLVALLLVPLPAAPPFPPREQLLAAAVGSAVVVEMVVVVVVPLRRRPLSLVVVLVPLLWWSLPPLAPAVHPARQGWVRVLGRRRCPVVVVVIFQSSSLAPLVRDKTPTVHPASSCSQRWGWVLGHLRCQ